MKRLKKIRITGAILISIQFILSVLLVYFIISLKLVPVKLSILAAVVLGVMAVVEMLMLLRRRTGIVAIILSVLFIAVLSYGIYMVRTTDNALDSVTGNKVEYEQVNVYVKKDDPANSINDAVLSGYVFGYIDNTNMESINKTVQEINASQSANITVSGFSSVVEMIKALENQSIQALITSTGMIEVLDSTEEYPGYSENLKVIMENEIELEVSDEVIQLAKPKDDKRFCVYISGIDTYGSVTLKSRSDVNIIAVFNETTHTVLLISTPRDYYIYLANSGSAKDKLTHAGIYGIEVSIKTLEMLYDVELPYYVRMNFSGFQSIIDKLGGIDVYSEYAFSTDQYSFSQGTNHLDGRSALAFARERYSFSEGDRQRGRNQMQVIKAVFSKMISSQMLANYSSIMDELSSCFQTNMTKDEVGKLVQDQLDSGSSWNILTYSVNGADSTDYCYSLGGNAYVMVPYQEDIDYANTLISTVLGDGIMTQEEIDNH